MYWKLLNYGRKCWHGFQGQDSWPPLFVVQHLSTCEFLDEQDCGLDRWVVRRFLSGTALAYADTSEEGKEIAELLQAESENETKEKLAQVKFEWAAGAKKVESLGCKIVDKLLE